MSSSDKIKTDLTGFIDLFVDSVALRLDCAGTQSDLEQHYQHIIKGALFA